MSEGSHIESQEVRLARIEERQIGMDRTMGDKFDSLKETIVGYHQSMDARLTGLATKVRGHDDSITALDKQITANAGEYNSLKTEVTNDKRWAGAIIGTMIAATIAVVAAIVGRDRPSAVASANASMGPVMEKTLNGSQIQYPFDYRSTEAPTRRRPETPH